jgi:16S rRNA (guanine527-N7)-methyltransferase
MPAASSDILGRGLAALDLPDAERLARLMERYIGELSKWNPRYGLVNASGDELVIKHVLDSLSAWRLIDELCRGGENAGRPPDASSEGGAADAGRMSGAHLGPGSVLDVGSGAGFPGIPLAAALPRLSFVLLERSTKRCVFMENCAVLLGLPNVRVVEADLGRADSALHARGKAGGSGARAADAALHASRAAALETFDVITFRAVAPLGRFLENLERSGLQWRSIVAYKGKAARVEEELGEIGPQWAPRARVQPVSVPFLDDERCLVVIRA